MTRTNCPACDGRLLAGHVGGILEYKHESYCTLLVFEDATKVADYDRHASRPYGYRRPMTPTERTLLEFAGYAVPDGTQTIVQHATPGVRLRRWPGLSMAQPEAGP